MRKKKDLTNEEISEIREMYVNYISIQEILNRFNITIYVQRRICKDLKSDRKANEIIIKQNIVEKLCPFCNQVKSKDEFANDKSVLDGKTTHCKECRHKHTRKYQSTELAKEKRKQRSNIPEVRQAIRANNRKKYTDPNKRESFLIYRRAYSKRPNVRETVNRNSKKRRENDPNYKIKKSCQRRIVGALRRVCVKKSNKTIDLIGCSYQYLRKYLESLWKSGMSWDNYGFGSDKWHIDHILPCASFDLTLQEEQKKCFHFTNLQPLWQSENLAKSNKILFSNSS